MELSLCSGLSGSGFSGSGFQVLALEGEDWWFERVMRKDMIVHLKICIDYLCFDSVGLQDLVVALWLGPAGKWASKPRDDVFPVGLVMQLPALVESG